MTASCNIPTCPTPWAPHDMHLFSEPESPLAMRVAPDRKSVYLWLPNGDMVKQPQPDAVAKLRAVLRSRRAS